MKFIGTLIGLIITAVILSLPLAWMVMLAAGNLFPTLGLSFVASIPIALIIASIGKTTMTTTT